MPSAATPAADHHALYVGEVMHHRLRPRRHRFVYRVGYLLLDLDRLDALDDHLSLFSVNRSNLVSFHERDHGPRDGSPLRPWVEARLTEHGIDEVPARILLLCMPRWLGHVFNPLSVYYCLGQDERPFAVVHQVKNTFGEQHAYVLPVDPDAGGARTIRQSCAKAFYVSPFMEMAASYRFRLGPPAQDRLSVIIQEEVQGQAQLVASLSGRRRPLTDMQLLAASLRHPTHKVIAGIHWEALRLWLKGLSLQPRPDPGMPNVEGLGGKDAGQLGRV